MSTKAFDEAVTWGAPWLPPSGHEPWDALNDRCASCGLPRWAISDGLVGRGVPCIPRQAQASAQVDGAGE